MSKKDDIINVASVPQRSPFRYPGGKTWFVPRLRQWLFNMPAKPRLFVEPFVGGGILSLTAAFEDLADHIIMAELDADVSAVWKTIIYGEAEWLANRILGFDLTIENARHQLNNHFSDPRELAFNTILRNRISHGGKMAPGAGVVKAGENNRGIKSRWYPETIAKRILDIQRIRHKIEFVEGDGFNVIKQYCDSPDAAFFIDPPYTAGGKNAGSRLYVHNQIDHNLLFSHARLLAGDFLMTYDKCNEIIDMATEYNLDFEPICMKNTHHAEMKELVIGRNLDWCR